MAGEDQRRFLRRRADSSLHTPALVLLGGLPMPIAVGTSLAVVGALIGSRFAVKVSPETLRKTFGRFDLIMASVILGEEALPIVGYVGAGLTLLVPAMTFACNPMAACPLRGLTSPRIVAA